MNTPRSFAFRKLTFAAALCLALIATLAFSPSARAALQTLMREIGGITYFESDQTPGQDTPSEEEVIVPEEMLSLEEARSKVPFTFNLPAWTPDGYTMDSSVRISYFPNDSTILIITWLKPQETGWLTLIELMVAKPGDWLVDLDHLQEVTINGEPAGLTVGGWDADSGQWETTHRDLTLTWVHDDVMYQLRSPGATVEELIRMAESIP